MRAEHFLARIAGAIVRRYPRRWRARYEQEMLALLDQRPPTFLEVLDLARGCVSESTPPTIGQIAVAMVNLVVANTALTAGGAAVNALLGGMVRPMPWFFVGPLVAILLFVRLMWRHLHRPDGTMPAREAATWRLVMIVAGVLFYAADAATGWNRVERAWGLALRIFVDVCGFPGVAFLFADLQSPHPWSFRPPASRRPAADVPKHPLGLSE
jgi:hypothetical protein